MSEKGAAHWSRWILVATILVMGAALLLTVWVTYRGVQDASDALVRGQASALQADLREEFGSLAKEVDQHQLDEILAAFEDSGLRYIALLQKNKVRLAAGESAARGALLQQHIRETRKQRMISSEGVVRLLLRGAGQRGNRRRARKGPPPIYVEFVPKAALALRSSSKRSLFIGASVAVLLLGMAGLIVRQYSRHDRQRQQEEADRRLRSLGEMSAVLAHEIRNPLASLKGNAQLLEKLVVKEAAGDKTVSKAGLVVSEARRLEGLINDLLDFARSGDLRRQDHDPAKLLRECARAIDAEAISVDTTGAPARWRLDASRMQQVLSNLLQNAVHASNRVEASVKSSAGGLVFLVRDHGKGIEGDSEALFEPFHTKKTKGTGLGLAVAKRLVELHGGTISARNVPDGGAEFRVEIPG